MVQLDKNHTLDPASNLVSTLNENARLTELAINENSSSLNSHKKAKTAHTSDQIKHKDELSVFQEIEISKKRLNNLILNADGSNVKEVIDLRVNNKGEVFNTANDRLFNTEKNIDGLYRELTKRNLMFEEYLNYQKIIFSVPARDHTRPFPQALSINQDDDELYVALSLIHI